MLVTPGSPARNVRHPVSEWMDGDFDLVDPDPAGGPPESWPEMGSSADGNAQRCADVTAAATTYERQLADVAVRAVETSRVFEPPVAPRVQRLSAADAARWMHLSSRLTQRSRTDGDLRLFNTACKLFGAARLAPSTDIEMQRPLEEAAELIAVTTAALHDRLASQGDQVLNEDVAHATSAPDVTRPAAGREPLRVCVLAGEGSAVARQLLARAEVLGVAIDAVCWYRAIERPDPPVESRYARAWYPPSSAPTASAEATTTVPEHSAVGWPEVLAALGDDVDIVLLSGMPIVPSAVLDGARLGVVNAHNGALPGYRGMDAIGWALLNDDPVVVTAHAAVTAVDAGPIFASRELALRPLDTLKARVKSTQNDVLLATAIAARRDGRLPAATAQHGLARTYYRMHPHLKRLLDASPYGR